MTYVPSPGNVADTYRELRAWVGPDAHRGTAAVALSTHHEMAELSRETRTAVLAMFKAEDEPCVEGLDWLPGDAVSFSARAHGEASTYRSGCRCQPCRDAHRERTRVYRDRNTAQLNDDAAVVKHGSDTTYNDFRCRCGECRQAHTERQRRDRQRAKAAGNATAAAEAVSL